MLLELEMIYYHNQMEIKLCRNKLLVIVMYKTFQNANGTGCPGPIFEISIANIFFLVEVRPLVPLSKKCPYGGTFCLNRLNHT